MGPQPPGAHPRAPPKMPLLVEWTFIMDWQELEKIPFGISECRRGRREAGTQREWEGLAWLQGAWLPSQPPHICGSPRTRTARVCMCVCVRGRAPTCACQMHPISILVGGPIGIFICVCLSICLSICVWGGDEWRTRRRFLFCVTDSDLPSQFTIPAPRTSPGQDDRPCLRGGEQ